MVDLSFEVDPLDINIAKVQFNLIKTFSSDNLELPVSEKFENNDPTLKISEVNVCCNEDKSAENNLILDAEVIDKTEKKYVYTLKTGNKSDIAAYLDNKEFLFAIKELVLTINKNI